MPGAVANDQSFDVTIVRGGIIGLVLATGLIKRNLNVKIYKQARGFREIGAGVVFTVNTMCCMNLLDPQIVEGLKRALTSNKDPNNPHNALQWVDGYNHDSANPSSTGEKLLFKLVPEAFQGCHRVHLLNELVKLIPEAVIEFNKHLDTCIDRGDDKKLLLNFYDGTTTEADADKLYVYSYSYSFLHSAHRPLGFKQAEAIKKC
jgi:salicylate hydroxylase